MRARPPSSLEPFLGLDAPVTSPLINAVIPSDGLCGPPTSNYPPPPPPPQNWGGAFVNAFCSFVTNPVGTIISIANAVYTAATEIAVLVTHLAQEAADLGGQLLARAAATLVSIGEAILSALEKLLAFVISVLEALLSPLMAPAESVASSVGSAIASAFESANATVAGGGSPSHAQLSSFWSALVGGPLNLILLSVSVGILAALVVLGELSLGAGLLIGVIVGLIAGAAMGAFSNLLSLGSGLSGFGYGLESTVHNELNGFIGRNASWPWFHTLGDLFVIPTDLFGGIMGLGLLADAYITESTLTVNYAVDLVVVVMGIILDVLSAAAAAAHQWAVAWVEAVAGVVLGIKPIYDLVSDLLFRKASTFLPGLRNFEVLSDVLGASSEAVGVGELVNGM